VNIKHSTLLAVTSLSCCLARGQGSSFLVDQKASDIGVYQEGARVLNGTAGQAQDEGIATQFRGVAADEPEEAAAVAGVVVGQGLARQA
jgi:hypothetical protein